MGTSRAFPKTLANTLGFSFEVFIMCLIVLKRPRSTKVVCLGPELQAEVPSLYGLRRRAKPGLDDVCVCHGGTQR